MLVGEKHTNVFALDVKTGALQWVQSADSETFTHTQSDGDTDGNSEGGANMSGGEGESRIFLLQREEFRVRALSAFDGQQHWNVTLSQAIALSLTQSLTHAVPMTFIFAC